MRLVAIILAIYTLTLSAFPCDDTVVINNAQTISITQDLENHSHNLADLCSPFCVCNCCSSNTIQQIQHFEEIAVEVFIKKIELPYNASLVHNYTAQIYQPPKV